jgi:TOBE domain
MYKVRLASGLTIGVTRANTERGAWTLSGGDRVWLSATPEACVLLDW